MKSPTFRTGTGRLALVEGLIERRKICDDALETDLHAMEKGLTFEAIPLEGIDLVGAPFRFDDQSNRPLHRALRRMPHMRR